MRVVIADTGPINYLILIGRIEILPALFGKIIIPSAVNEELMRPEAPDFVRQWMQGPPSWLEVQAPPHLDHDDLWITVLDDGERAALSLAAFLAADLVLMDDREAVRVARQLGFRVIGTLRILELGARKGLLVLSEAFEAIKQTNFRYRQEIMDGLLRGSNEL